MPSFEIDTRPAWWEEPFYVYVDSESRRHVHVLLALFDAVERRFPKECTTTDAESTGRSLKDRCVDRGGEIYGHGGEEGQLEKEGPERCLHTKRSHKTGVLIVYMFVSGGVEQLNSGRCLELNAFVWSRRIPLPRTSRGCPEERCKQHQRSRQPLAQGLAWGCCVETTRGHGPTSLESKGTVERHSGKARLDGERGSRVSAP